MRLLLVTLLVGCTSNSGLTSDPATLVATWRQVPAPFVMKPVDQRAVLVFGADHSFSLDERHGDPADTGTYTADDTSLTLDGIDGLQGYTTQIEDYVAIGDRLMLGPLLPDGAIDGVVGSWNADIEVRGTSGTKQLTTDLVLRADLTAHQTGHTLDGDVTIDGTYTVDDTEIVVTAMQEGVTVHLHLQRMPGADAIGGSLFERL